MSNAFHPFRALTAKANADYVQRLIDGIRNRDSNAFAAFYAITVEQVYRDFYRQLGSAYLVQDCVAKLYVLFVQAIGRIDTPAGAAGALRHIETKILDYVRTSGRADAPRDKRPQPALSADTSEILLIDLLDRLKLPENTVPLEMITAYDVYLKQKSAVLRWLIALAAAVLVMFPLLFLNPKGHLAPSGSVSSFTGRPSVTLTVNAVLPVRSVTATMNGQAVPIMQESRNTYTLLPTADGRLTVTVRTLGRGRYTDSLQIDAGD
jgi:DNA-directed RNA polymerase specialized sigma24 family protein